MNHMLHSKPDVEVVRTAGFIHELYNNNVGGSYYKYRVYTPNVEGITTQNIQVEANTSREEQVQMR